MTESNHRFDFDNVSPLFQAVAQDDVAHLHSLLQEGTSVNIRNHQENTLLHFAIMKEKRNAFDYLLTVDDILPDEENSRHSTPLMEAARLQNEYYVLELLKKNVDINHEHIRFKITPLHLAAEANNEKIVKALIENGADINCQDFGGDTPLQKACKDNSTVVHQLLYHGADTTIENFYGQRAFDVSMLNCPPEVQEIVYNCTFDGTISIRTVTVAMVHQVPILFKLIEENDVVYNEEDLEYLSYNLHKIPFQTLKIFMNTHYNVMENLFERYDLLSNVPSEQTQCFLNRDVTRRLSYSGSMMKKMISCENISEEEMTQLICYALSYGNSISAYDLYLIFDKFGYGELFSILLHMDTVPLSAKLLLVKNPRLILPAVIHNFRFSLLLLHEFDRCGDVTFLQKLKKFTRNRTIVAFEGLLDLGENASVAQVPSLLELARDVSRRHLIQTFEIKKNSDFFTILKSLPVNQIYKDILSYKKPIYP